MILAYDSMTGNVKRFVKKLGMEAIQVTESTILEQPFILITYTINFGQVPETTLQFLRENSRYMLGVASSGNRNWGEHFARAADIISATYSVPILHKFELSGTKYDVDMLHKEVERIVQSSPQLDPFEQRDHDA